MGDDHYFTAEPTSPTADQTITVTLAGRSVDVITARGVFSPGHVDLGTQVLMRHAPVPPAGTLLDLGCGWGPLALSAAVTSPATQVIAVDTNRRALDLVRRNAAGLGVADQIIACEPDQVDPSLEFDAVWSNPPIRIGKPALHVLLLRWLPRLRRGADAHLVVQRHLGADSLASWLAEQDFSADVTRVGSAKGFRVLRVTRR